mmetsp:Transcript_106279/g.298975  ORF Transcript_106279/g.298975 Transcript_106279/m.298975 type:complete len:400 (-) Transcript_106279:32-1231(-)
MGAKLIADMVDSKTRSTAQKECCLAWFQVCTVARLTDTKKYAIVTAMLDHISAPMAVSAGSPVGSKCLPTGFESAPTLIRRLAPLLPLAAPLMLFAPPAPLAWAAANLPAPPSFAPSVLPAAVMLGPSLPAGLIPWAPRGMVRGLSPSTTPPPLLLSAPRGTASPLLLKSSASAKLFSLMFASARALTSLPSDVSKRYNGRGLFWASSSSFRPGAGGVGHCRSVPLASPASAGISSGAGAGGGATGRRCSKALASPASLKGLSSMVATSSVSPSTVGSLPSVPIGALSVDTLSPTDAAETAPSDIVSRISTAMTTLFLISLVIRPRSVAALALCWIKERCGGTSSSKGQALPSGEAQSNGTTRASNRNAVANRSPTTLVMRASASSHPSPLWEYAPQRK